MAACTGCGAAVDDMAKVCPACGRPSPALSMGARVVVVPAIFVAIVFVGFKACFMAFGNG